MAFTQETINVSIQKLFDEYGLSPIARIGAMKWVQLSMEDDEGGVQNDLYRLRGWILNHLNGGKGVHRLAHPHQTKCPGLIPHLRARPFWDSSEFDWVKEVEGKYLDIKKELLSLQGFGGFQPYRGPSWSATALSPDGIGGLAHDAGHWNVYYLLLHNLPFEENCGRCPVTMAVLKSIPRLYEHAFFSALAPGTHITAHNGPTNKKLRVQLPLIVPGNNCILRSGDERVHLQEGKIVIFDDSFEHEAWNNDLGTRIILIFDIWHPDFHDKEVKFYSTLQHSQLRMEKRMLEARRKAIESGADVEAVENFYDVIQQASNIGVEEAILWS